MADISAPVRRAQRRGRRCVVATVVGVAGSVLSFSRPALAHDAPEGSEWVMADWMFGSFVLFLGSGVLVFVVAWRRGLMRDVEMAKYPMLDIIEPDFYEPEWAIDASTHDEADRSPTREENP